MRLVSWIFRAFLFLVALGFALTNQDIATLRFFGASNFEWRAPMVIFLLVFFAAGTVLGLIAVVPTLFRQRREIGRLRKQLTVANKAQPAVLPPLVDAPPAIGVTSPTAARLGI
jgi:lipopolysaccharide assembly protein A